jgi:streptogramin lyase
LAKSPRGRQGMLCRFGLALFLILTVVSVSIGNAPLPAAKASPPSANLLEWPVPHGSAELSSIRVDDVGRVWFTENSSGRLAYLDPEADTMYEWRANANSHNIVVGGRASAFGSTSSNRIYFAEYSRNLIAFFDNVTGWVNWITEFGSLTGTNPATIAIDSLGNIWFTESGASSGDGYIGELTGIITPTDHSPPRATLIEWQLPSYSSGTFTSDPCACLPWGIYLNQTGPTATVASETYVWFTEKTGGTGGAGAVGRLQVSTSTLTLWDLGVYPLNGVHAPTGITVDSAGNAYWVNSAPAANSISFLSTKSFVYREFAAATSGAMLKAPTLDEARKALWALEYAGNKIAYLDLNSTAYNVQLMPISDACKFSPSPSSPQLCPGAGEVARPVSSISSRSLGTLENGVETMTSLSTPTSQSLGTPLGPTNNIYEYNLLSAGAAPSSMTLDANGSLWFTESGSAVNRIAQIQFPTMPNPIPEFSATPILTIALVAVSLAVTLNHKERKSKA